LRNNDAYKIAGAESGKSQFSITNQALEMKNELEWHNIADVNVQRVCDNSIVALTLYVKIINGERFYKVNGEHVRLLPYTEYVNGFGYTAVTSSYRLYL
jgi:hypothetical protein